VTRIGNPHVKVDGGYWGEAGPPGRLRGCVHASDETIGLTWQCGVPSCETIATHTWEAIEDHCETYLQEHGDGVLDAVPLPPCPGCGAIWFMNNSDVEYGLEMPHHYTRRALDEHVLQRPKLKGRFAVNRHGDHERWQGLDFSHKAKKDRPAHHQKLAARHVGPKADRTPDHPDG
jgi:hypothetical protein